jgi:phage tail sheath gpL-like
MLSADALEALNAAIASTRLDDASDPSGIMKIVLKGISYDIPISMSDSANAIAQKVRT